MPGSLDTVQKEIYRFIKGHRKTFHKRMYKRWGDNLYLSVPGAFEAYYLNPALGVEIHRVIFTLNSMRFQTKKYAPLAKDYEKVWHKVKKRFYNYLGRRVLRNDGKFPQGSPTMAIKEFIARGFVHGSEVNLDIKNRWVVQAHIAQLVWPEDFKDQCDAIAIQERYGIPGYTEVKTLKKT